MLILNVRVSEFSKYTLEVLLKFFVLLHNDPVAIQTSDFQIVTYLFHFLIVKQILFFENLDVFKSIFKVFELCNIVF